MTAAKKAKPTEGEALEILTVSGRKKRVLAAGKFEEIYRAGRLERVRVIKAGVAPAAVKDIAVAMGSPQEVVIKNLAVSISIEAAELLELFQWQTGEESTRFAAENRERVSEEIADVAIYLVELADIAGIDLAKAIDAKLEKNARKYPVDKARGVSTKYTDLK